MKILENVHVEWIAALENVLGEIERIERSLQGQLYNPEQEDIFRVLRKPPAEISVAIFGQDPYPTPGHAMGLAFSVPADVKPIPKTLINIFRELNDDLGYDIPSSGELSLWEQQGVALINRILTTPQRESAGHLNLRWQVITDEIAKVLGARDVVAILWGKHAQELVPFFNEELIISSPHPSPLSAYRGFFGSKPFSRTNQLLALRKKRAIDWSLA